MKNVVLVGTVLLINSIMASAYSADAGTLVVDQPIEIKYKKSTQYIQVGDYKAEMKLKNKGLLHQLYLDYNVETSPEKISGSLKINKGTFVIGQNYMVEKDRLYKEEIISEEMKETRSCIIQTFYTQENCRIVPTLECNRDIFNEPTDCWRVERIACDSVRHDIKGIQDVVFVKTSVQNADKIIFKKTADKTVMATYTSPIRNSSSEKIISATRCKM